MKKREFIYNRIIGFLIISIMLVIYFHFGQIYVAVGPSMKPTILEGERIYINKRSYSSVSPLSNDVVFLKSPKDGILLVKRIVAKEGDLVEISEDGVSVNNKLLSNSSGFGQNNKFILNKGQYFALGDNRVNSSDSRDFGPLKKDNILGKVIFVIWPLSQLRLIK